MTSTQPITEDRPLAWTTPDGRYTIVVAATRFTYTVTVYSGTYRHDALCRTFGDEDQARTFARDIAKRLRDGATVAQVVAAIQPAADVIAAAEQICIQAAKVPTPRLAPAAKGTTQHVSDPGHRVLAAAAVTGRILRGRIEDGRAPITTINALARRGYLRRIDVKQGLRTVTIGGEITDKGRRRLAELDAANSNPIAA